jgi:hypothetical protein
MKLSPGTPLPRLPVYFFLHPSTHPSLHLFTATE